MVHQHQRLPLVNPHASLAVAFHPGPVDQPPGGQLYAAFGGRIVRHVGIFGKEPFRDGGFDHRILEETARVAQHGRVGKFCAADRADRLADVAQRGASAGFDLALHVAVAQFRTRRMREAYFDGCDDHAPFQVVLEDAFAVAESAVRGVERQQVARFDAVHLDPADRVLRFAAVGPDVLHRGGPRLAGDQREVFDAPQTAFDGPFHQVVPFDARLDAQANFVAVVAQKGDLPGHGGQQHAVVIFGEKDVVAPGEHRPPPGNPRGEKRAQILGRFEFYEACGPLVDAETVAPAQADLVKFSNHGMQS